MPSILTRRVGALSALLVALLLAGAGSLRAQEGTPVGTPGVPPADAPAGLVHHPAHVHAGSCDQLGEVIYPLDAVLVPTGVPIGFAGPRFVATSFTTLDAPLGVLIADPHAINVHLSDEAIDVYIACGEIGGRQRPDGSIPVALREVNGSGFWGIATIAPNAENPERTDVVIYLAEEDPLGEEEDAIDLGTLATAPVVLTETPTAGTPEGRASAPGTPDPAAAGRAVQVQLDEYRIEMPLTLPAGPTTFEVANIGQVPHNFEIEGQGIERAFEEELQPGETKTLEVDLRPGDYTVSCPIDGHRALGMEQGLVVNPS